MSALKPLVMMQLKDKINLSFLKISKLTSIEIANLSDSAKLTVAYKTNNVVKNSFNIGSKISIELPFNEYLESGISYLLSISSTESDSNYQLIIKGVE